MSPLIAKRELEGQRVPFSHTTQMGYSLMKIQPHSTATLYSVQVVFTVKEPFFLFACLCICKPHYAPTSPCLPPSVSPHACLSHQLHLCWHTWASGLRFMPCSRLLTRDLRHSRLDFNQTKESNTVSYRFNNFDWQTRKHDCVKQKKTQLIIAHLSNNNRII